MDAIIFDFDGVVVDSEPVHLAAFQKVLRPEGVDLTRDAYYCRYLGMDDLDCFRAAARDAGVDLRPNRIEELIAAKTSLVQDMFAATVEPMPGAVELIRSAADAGLPLAICSGALREEIRQAARAVGVLECFDVIVSAEDVSHGKPDPAGYMLARTRLEEKRDVRLVPARCIVVEDAPAGIDAAHAAGMPVQAVATSYPAEALRAAERVAASLKDVTLADMEAMI